MSKTVPTPKLLPLITIQGPVRKNDKENNKSNETLLTPYRGTLRGPNSVFAELDKAGSTASKSGAEASKRISSASFLKRWREREGKGGKTRKRKRRRKRKTRKRKRKKSRKKRKRRKRKKTRR